MIFSLEAEFICIEGWHSALYEEALLWVDGVKRVAFLSEEERLSSDPRIQIYSLETPLQWEPLIKKMAWSAVFKKLEVIGSERFCQEVERHHLAAHLLLSEASDWWAGAMQNARANQAPYRDGLLLKGAFAHIPAIIVGAGPSLAKNRHLLASFADRALILAGGSALNEIEEEPHFAASIDAEAPYRQFKMHPFWQTPFCYQARMNRDNFSLVHGERLLFPDSSSLAINWIYGQAPFDSGWTVGTFLTAIAAHFGCDPIVLVGMDLCYQEGEKYSHLPTHLPEGLIQANGFLTQRDWLMAAQWLEARKERLINATEGGMLSLPAEKLENLLAQFPLQKDLRQKVHAAIQALPVIETSRWREWDLSLQRCRQEKGESEEEIVYQKLLLPLWQIWRPIFAREVEIDPRQQIALHQKAFFEQVLEEHDR